MAESRWLHARHRLGENFGDGIPALLRRAGFSDARMASHRAMLAGHVAYFRGAAL
jgi:hypothetical protein